MRAEQGDSFSLDTVNLAELTRLTGISRGKARALKSNDFVVTPHGRRGKKSTLLEHPPGFTLASTQL